MTFHSPFTAAAAAALLASSATAFYAPALETRSIALSMTADESEAPRRDFLVKTSALLLGGAASGIVGAMPVSAKVFFDPAMYGDQELRVSAVDSLRESVRRAILQNPKVAPAFYELALLDGLSYNAKTGEGGPDGRIIRQVLESKSDDPHIKALQEAANTLILSAQKLRKLSSITISDAVAIGGTEAIASIGGPVVSVQIGRTDAPKTANLSPLPLDLFSGNVPFTQVTEAFRRSGLTEREMTALLGGLLTIESVEKDKSPGDWKASSKPKFRERGKIGRMSEYKRLTDEDIQAALDADDEDDEEDPDDGWYIAETFGTRDQSFGKKVAAGDFNRFLKELYQAYQKKGDVEKFGWIASALLDKNNPTAQSWLQKYAGSTLNYQKDFSVAFNSVTQLGAEFTGGKYESLLKGRPRKTLNDD